MANTAPANFMHAFVFSAGSNPESCVPGAALPHAARVIDSNPMDME